LTIVEWRLALDFAEAAENDRQSAARDFRDSPIRISIDILQSANRR